MAKLTLILNQNRKDELSKLAKELKPIKFKKISFAPLPDDYLCMVVDSAKPRKKKGGNKHA